MGQDAVDIDNRFRQLTLAALTKQPTNKNNNVPDRIVIIQLFGSVKLVHLSYATIADVLNSNRRGVQMAIGTNGLANERMHVPTARRKSQDGHATVANTICAITV